MFISVIVPTYQRPDLLEKCLAGLHPERQALEKKFYEVIVTDDSRNSDSKNLVQEKFPWAKWTEGPHRGPAANRNNGATQALGEWLAFLDDDCLPDSQWLSAIKTTASSNELDVIEGKTVTPDKVDNPFHQGIENLTGDSYWSCNLAVRREVFFKLGAFDEDFLEAGGEDMEFAFRIRKNKLRVRFVKEALVLHPSRSLSFKQLLWRTYLNRWIILYRIKTGTVLPPGTSSLRIIFNLFRIQLMALLRTTFHLFSKPDPSLWRTRVFFQIWSWLTFPIVFPILVKWEFRFRKQHLGRTKL